MLGLAIVFDKISVLENLGNIGFLRAAMLIEEQCLSRDLPRLLIS